MRKAFLFLLCCLVSVAAIGQSQTARIATQYVSIPRGTIIHAIGASNMSGYGSGIPWSQLMVQTNDFFINRVKYHQWGALGATPADEMTQYVQHAQADCLAAKAGTGIETWVIVETNVNGFTSAQDQFNQTQAVWLQAKADGCKVAAMTAGDFYQLPQAVIDLNTMIRGANAANNGNGVQLTSNYDMLIDENSAVPYDGCNAGVTACASAPAPYVANGSFADTGHLNLTGAQELANYAACVLITRSTCLTLRTRSVNPIPDYSAVNKSTATDYYYPTGVYNITGAGGNVANGTSLSNLEFEGKAFTIHNGGTAATSLYVPASNGVYFDGYANGTTGNNSGPILQPGDSVDFIYQAGVFYQTHKIVPQARPFGTLATQAGPNTDPAVSGDLQDCAGNQYGLNVNGTADPVGHKFSVYNSSSTATCGVFKPSSSVYVNGANQAFSIPPHWRADFVSLGTVTIGGSAVIDYEMQLTAPAPGQIGIHISAGVNDNPAPTDVNFDCAGNQWFLYPDTPGRRMQVVNSSASTDCNVIPANATINGSGGTDGAGGHSIPHGKRADLFYIGGSIGWMWSFLN